MSRAAVTRQVTIRGSRDAEGRVAIARRATGRDQGSASVYLVTAMAVVVTIAAADAGVGAAVIARHRAATAADAAALAAASQTVDGADACRTATAVALTDGGELTSCQVSGPFVVVTTKVSLPAWLPGGSATGRSRAGP